MKTRILKKRFYDNIYLQIVPGYYLRGFTVNDPFENGFMHDSSENVELEMKLFIMFYLFKSSPKNLVKIELKVFFKIQSLLKKVK